MVAKITCPTNLRNIVNYNENKVKQGLASCLHAANYLKDADQMNIHEKMERIKRNIELSTAKTRLLHITLNFDPSERMNTEKMVTIANDYMQRIGFGHQPYLVYEHRDAAHPHCHLVTTNIKDDGRRIDTFNIGKKLSEPARKSIEVDYQLIKAEGLKQQQKEREPVQKAQYGKTETKRSITNALDKVLDTYKYASLAELNALLRLYNVEADRGKEGSRTFEKRGLHYRIISEKGEKIGVPIKASSIHNKPTLDNLEDRFEANKAAKTIDDKKELKTRIDWTLAQSPGSLNEFRRALQRENVDVLSRQNDKGLVYGLTYIDHNSKAVFNGSDLGKHYSAKGIQQQLSVGSNRHPDLTKENEGTKEQYHWEQTKDPAPEADNRSQAILMDKNWTAEKEEAFPPASGKAASFTLLENIIASQDSSEALNRELLEEEKRKRRRSLDYDQEHEM